MPKTYITTSGDMWDMIARRELGNEMYTDTLMKANIKYRNTFIFPAGVALTIPVVTMKTPDTLPPWKRGAEV